MDDLTSKINELLSDPQAMQQLNSLAASLGLGNSTPNTPTPPGQNAPAGNNPLQGLDLSSLAGLLGNAGSTAPGGGNIPQSPGAPGGLDGDTLQVVSKILPLLSTFRQEDNNTRLLHALRPLLGPERQKKVDEAIKMLSMLRLLPVLRGQGIL